MKFSLVFVLVITVAIPALAQTEPTPLRDAADREAIRLARTVHIAAPQAAPVQERSWVARHPVLTGTLIGVGIGVPMGVVICKVPSHDGSSCADYTFPRNARIISGLMFGLAGAGIGAGLGALIGTFGR